MYPLPIFFAFASIYPVYSYVIHPFLLAYVSANDMLNPVFLEVFFCTNYFFSSILKVDNICYCLEQQCLEAIVSPKTCLNIMVLHYDIGTFCSFFFLWNCSPFVFLIFIPTLYAVGSQFLFSSTSLADDLNGLWCLEQLDTKFGCEDGHCSSWLLLQKLLPIIFYRNLWLIWVLWNSSSLDCSAFVLIRSGKKANKRLEVLSIHAGREYAWILCIE